MPLQSCSGAFFSLIQVFGEFAVELVVLRIRKIKNVFYSAYIQYDKSKTADSINRGRESAPLIYTQRRLSITRICGEIVSSLIFNYLEANNYIDLFFLFKRVYVGSYHIKISS
jgi:hypothetical protein